MRGGARLPVQRSARVALALSCLAAAAVTAGSSRAGDPGFVATISPIGPSLRSTMTGVSWRPGCPVGLRDLRVVTARHRGFDGRVRTGRLIVHATSLRTSSGVAAAVRGAVPDPAHGSRRRLRRRATSARSRPTTPRPSTAASSTGTSRWSEHAYGRAIDVNPIENPYVTRRARLAPRQPPVRRAHPAGPAWLPRATHWSGFRRRRLGLGRALGRHQGLPALLGHRPLSGQERATGLEPATSSLEGWSSTIELHPRGAASVARVDPYAWSWNPEALVAGRARRGVPRSLAPRTPRRRGASRASSRRAALIVVVFVTPAGDGRVRLPRSGSTCSRTSSSPSGRRCCSSSGCRRRSPPRSRRAGRIRALTHPLVALPLWLATYAVWHIPPLYDAALGTRARCSTSSTRCYLVTGLALWWCVLQDEPHRSRAGGRAGVRLRRLRARGPARARARARPRARSTTSTPTRPSGSGA